MNFYNEHDTKAAAWLRELIRAGEIPPGDVDERDIQNVKPTELAGYTQCHFFAGIGGWAEALRLAGWPTDEPVWTGSCPCQPFSVAGEGKGTADERHLWPVFAELIRACKPPIVFGEQVASKAGREWLAGVFADLEGMGYQRAGADLCAAGVGAPHIRQRLYWLAESRLGARGQQVAQQVAQQENGAHPANQSGDGCEDALRLADADVERLTRESLGLMGAGYQAHWLDCDILPCLDGKIRRIESGTFPLAHGIPGRVGLLRGYGNAIVPQVAAEFIKAVMCEFPKNL